MTITTGARVIGSRLAGVFLITTVVWAVSLIAAPYLTTHHSAQRPSLRTAALVYVLGSMVCHQLPARSFHAWGVQVPVCARCVGLYASAPFGAALALVWGAGMSQRIRFRMTGATRLRAVLVVVALPTLVTWVGEWAWPHRSPWMDPHGGGRPAGRSRFVDRRSNLSRKPEVDWFRTLDL